MQTILASGIGVMPISIDAHTMPPPHAFRIGSRAALRGPAVLSYLYAIPITEGHNASTMYIRPQRP